MDRAPSPIKRRTARYSRELSVGPKPRRGLMSCRVPLIFTKSSPMFVSSVSTSSNLVIFAVAS